MSRLRFPGLEEDPVDDWAPIPFPGRDPDADHDDEDANVMGFVGPGGSSSGRDVLDAFDRVSRRMEDLARALGCLGHFDDDDDDDRPTAA